MGCVNHPDVNGRTFMCSGDLQTVYSPYYIDAGRAVEYPHWNGARAFTDEKTYAVPVLSEEGLAVIGQLGVAGTITEIIATAPEAAA